MLSWASGFARSVLSPGRLALELPAARVSGWLSNEASAGRDPVAAWLEEASRTFIRSARRDVPYVHEEDFDVGDHWDRSAQGVAHGGRDRRRGAVAGGTRGRRRSTANVAFVGVGGVVGCGADVGDRVGRGAGEVVVAGA